MLCVYCTQQREVGSTLSLCAYRILYATTTTSYSFYAATDHSFSRTSPPPPSRALLLLGSCVRSSPRLLARSSFAAGTPALHIHMTYREDLCKCIMMLINKKIRSVIHDKCDFFACSWYFPSYHS